jgi:hypothetical protein
LRKRRRECSNIGASGKSTSLVDFRHCQGDNVTLGITYIADWFSDKLDVRQRM